MKHTISRTLITAVVSITVVAMGMSFAISALNIENLVTDLASEKLTNRLTNVSTQVESWYDSLNVAFQELTNELYRSPNLTLAEKEDVIYDAFRAFPNSGYLHDLYAGFPDKGFVYLADFTPTIGYDPTSSDWYKLACEHPGETVITPAYVTSDSSANWCITIARTIHPKDGSLGVLAADYTVRSLNKLVSSFGSGNSNIIILQNDGNLITYYDVVDYANDYGVIESVATLDNGNYKVFYDTLKAEVGNTFRLTVKGVDNYYACRKIGNGWYVLAFESASTFRAPLYNTVILLLIVSCTSIIGIVFTMAFVTNRQVGKPLKKLTAAIREFSVDDTVSFAGIEINTNNELKILADTLKSMELRMRAAFNEAQAANLAKGSFLSRMSHEMRTPMTAIIGMTEIAQREKEPAKIQECLEKVNDSADHLLGIINDILDMSKIEAGKMELSETDFKFQDLLDQVSAILDFKLTEKRHNFTIHVDDNMPKVITADRHRLAQIITNLLSNANKFTPDGGNIDLRICYKAEDSDKHCRLLIEVEDDGAGIPGDQQQRLFNAFEQANNSIARLHGGTGLGLAISKSIANMMDGDIWVNSEPGKGSVFSFSVRVGIAESDDHSDQDVITSEEELENIFAGKSILLADDVEINRDILITLLENTGVAIDCAENGKEAYDKFAANPRAYGLIFMDIHMPEMDGYESTGKIRGMDIPEARAIPIIAMTADVFSGDIEKCLAAGMNDHVGKPLDINTVIAKMKRYLL